MTTENGMTTKRRLTAIMAVGGLAAGGAAALAAAHTGSTTAAAAMPRASTTAAATPGPGGPPPASGGAGRGGGLTVTRVSGHTIIARDGNGRTITVLVGATTTYSEAGTRVALSAVAAGEHIAVQTAGVKAGAATSATTLSATGVTIMLPQVMGRVTAIHGASLTIKGVNGASVTIKTTATTRYVKAGGAATSASALKTGVAIVAEGTLAGNGKTITARRVTIGVSTAGPGAGPGGPGGGTPPGGPGGGTGGTPPPAATPGA